MALAPPALRGFNFVGGFTVTPEFTALLVGLVLYVVLGGADFGAGFWDLLAGGTRQGASTRELIEHKPPG